MNRALPLLLALCALAIGCGKSSTSVQNGGAPVGSGQNCQAAATVSSPKVSLLLFGAPWCENCHRDFPTVQSLLNQVPAAQRAGLNTQLFVETGGRITDAATPQIAEIYRESLSLCSFAPAADSHDNGNHPTFQTYTKYTGVPIDEAAIPAAVLLDANGNVTDTFLAGGTTFVPQKIIETVTRRLTAAGIR